MPGPMEGVRVVEVAGWTFVPAAGAVLADLGAEVIKDTEMVLVDIGLDWDEISAYRERGALG